MKIFLVALLAICASTNASEVTEKRGIASTGDFGSEHDGLYSGSHGSVSWKENDESSSGWTTSNIGHVYHPPTEINTYIQPTRIITKIIRIPVHVHHPVHVERPVPFPVLHPVPVYINKPYPVNINRPVPVYIEKPVAVPVTVGHSPDYSAIHGSNNQVGAPVVEQLSSDDYRQSHQGHLEHYTNVTPAVGQISSGSGYQSGKQRYNYKSLSKTWN